MKDIIITKEELITDFIRVQAEWNASGIKSEDVEHLSERIKEIDPDFKPSEVYNHIKKR